MKKLERDKTVAKWTKNHGITIQYVTEAGNVRGYRPDFLIERIDGAKELHEVKGGQFINSLQPTALLRVALRLGSRLLRSGSRWASARTESKNGVVAQRKGGGKRKDRSLSHDTKQGNVTFPMPTCAGLT